MLSTSHHVDPKDLIAMLSDLSTEDDRSSSVQIVETHISWVFLTGQFAYKLKKPVRFDFLDFSTVERRHQACLEEVRLNRRLAPNVYFGVLPITWDDTVGLGLAGYGAPVDWVVYMRRLRADFALDRRLAAGRVSTADIQLLVDLLTAFYRNATRVVISGHEYRSALQKKIRTNADECLQLISHAHRNRLRVILGRQLVYLHCAAALLNERARAGRIIEGHGDLRPEHVYLELPPIVIDCIEFSSQMRRLDVLDDLAFLTMELERSGHSATGERIVSACQASLDDVAEPQLIKFHKAHHALVRAKVMMLQAAQLPSDGRHTPLRIAQQYINWAEHYACQLGHPLLIIVGGLMGTGKSTLANRVAEAIGAAVLSTDQIRRKLYGRSSSPADYGVGNYALDRRANTYDQLFDSAADLIDKDRSVVLDGTFLQHKLREHAASMARRHGSIAFYVHCTCPRHVAIERLTARAASREGDSEGRPDLFDEQSTCQEPLSAEPRFVSIDTTQEINEQCQKVFEAIAVLELR